MQSKFKITLEDGTIIESHDENWNEVKTHAHALSPHSTKKWLSYEIITDAGPTVAVNFQNGLFKINGMDIHIGDENLGPLTFSEEKQEFPVSEEWKILNGLPYFPVVGRTFLKGDWGMADIRFCGWKKKVGDKTVRKTVSIYPNGQIVLI